MMEFEAGWGTRGYLLGACLPSLSPRLVWTKTVAGIPPFDHYPQYVDIEVVDPRRVVLAWSLRFTGVGQAKK